MIVTYGSVCSGIEAASVAWHTLGWAPAWFAEIEPFPSAVLAHHWPQVQNLGDFTAIRDKVSAGDVESPDVLVGGTPCQAFSVAGLRQSLDDKRGQLTLEFVRLADALDSARSLRGKLPATIVWENVPGVLNTPDNAFGCFLAGLVGEDDPLEPPGGRWTNAGYVRGPRRTVAWRILDAQYFGVAQRRRRVFVVASAGGVSPEQVLFELDGVRRDSAPRREAGQGATHDVASCLTSDGRGVERTGETRGQDPVVAVPDVIGTLTKQFVNQSMGAPEVDAGLYLPVSATGDVFHTLRGEGFDASDDGTGRGVGAVAVPILEVGKRTGTSTTDPRAGLGIADDGDPMYTLQAGAQHGVAVAFSSKDYGADAYLDLAPTMRSMGHNESHANGGGQLAVAFQATDYASGAFEPVDQSSPITTSADRTRAAPIQVSGVPALAACVTSREGNRFDAESTTMVPVAFQSKQSASAQAPSFDSISPTLDVAKAGGMAALVGMQVRRLTPTECERLQGFPDGHTRIPWKFGYWPEGSCPPEAREALAEQCPDGPRYKALGNSMAVPVMRWIGARIARQLEASA